MTWRAGVLAALFFTAPVAVAAPVPGVCNISAMVNRVLAPLNEAFPVQLAAPLPAAVTIDAERGEFKFDGGSFTVPAYPFLFSQANDVMTWAHEVFSGTLDAAGNLTLARVRLTICTFGTPVGTDCVPGNLCSNDLTRLCIPGAGAGVGCEAGGICQGVCRDDRTRTCAGDMDCGPGGFCGTGRLVPFTMTLKTAPSQFGDLTVEGNPLDFTTGTLTIAYINATPPESPTIGDTGVSGFSLTCTLDPIPDRTTLPPPATWEPKRGVVELGSDGPAAADDALRLLGVFGALGGTGIFEVDPLVVAVGTSDATAVTIEVPAGMLRANRKRTRFKLRDTGGVVRVTPRPPGGVVPTHKIVLKRRHAGGYLLSLTSKGLRLDALSAPQVLSAITLGAQHAAASGAARTKGRRVTF